MGREVCRTEEMEVRSSLQKISGSSDCVATLNSEEFVLVPQHADDTSTKDEGKPELKVFFFFSTNDTINILNYWFLTRLKEMCKIQRFFSSIENRINVGFILRLIIWFVCFLSFLLLLIYLLIWNLERRNRRQEMKG